MRPFCRHLPGDYPALGLLLRRLSDYSQRMTTSTTGVGSDVDTSILRSFNRAWSQRVGVMEESFLGTGRSFGASRLLVEIGTSGAGVLELPAAPRARLRLPEPSPPRARGGGPGRRTARPRRPAASPGGAHCRGTARDRPARGPLGGAGCRVGRTAGPVPASTAQRRAGQRGAVDSCGDRLRGSGGRVVDGGRRRRTPLLRRARRALPRRIRPGRCRDDRRSGHDSPARRVPGRQGGRRGGGLRRRPAAHQGSRRDQADVGGRRVARVRARSPDAHGARGRDPAARLPRGLPRHQQHAGRGDRHVRAVRLPSDRALQRQPVRGALVRQAAPGH